MKIKFHQPNDYDRPAESHNHNPLTLKFRLTDLKDEPELSPIDDPVDASPEASGIYGGVATSSAGTFDRTDSPNQESDQAETANLPKTASRGLVSKPPQWSTSVQNLLDQPTAAFPRQLILGGMAFCLAFGTWAWFGKINEVGQARGELMPQGDVYKVHPVEMGQVADVTVEEGDLVKAGQVLVELDTRLAEAELERLQQQLSAYQIQRVQTEGLIDRTRLEANSRAAITQAEIRAQLSAIAQGDSKVNVTEALLNQLQADLTASYARKERLQALEAKSQELLDQLEADVTAQTQRQERLQPLESKSEALLTHLEANVTAQQERIERIRPLVEEGAVSREVLFQAEQALRDSQNAIIRAQLSEQTLASERVSDAEQTLRDRQNAIIRAQLSEQTLTRERIFEVEQAIRDRESRITETEGQLAQAIADVDRLQAQLAQKQAEGERASLETQQRIRQLELELTQLEAKIAESRNLLTTAQAKLEQRYIYAPGDGVVLSLEIAHSGEVVQAGQTIAEIAPQDAPLVLSAKLPNPEAGFIKVGMPVQIKFDAYPYQDYGIITGTVTHISADAKQNQQLGDVYDLEITLDRNYVTEGQETIYFKPGQTASADIIIRERRIIDLLLDPLKKLQAGELNL
jgi:hemolysin D